MADAPRSLFQEHPRHVEAPLGLLLSLATIIVGLTLPVMSIEKLIFWEDSYSILQGAASLWENSHYFLAVLIFGFSVVFPNLKLAALGVIWFVPLEREARKKALWWTKALGKWSMLDVFVVALTIVLSQSEGLLDARPRAGLYVFSAGVLASLVVTIWIDSLAHGTDGK